MPLIAELQTEITKEPTAQDSIAKIIDLLENNKVSLTPYYLKKGEQFCVLGLFANEYPGGYWTQDRDYNGIYTFTDDQGESQAGCLTEAVSKYYQFKDSTTIFNIDELPAYIQVLLLDYTWRGRMSLSVLNDLLLFNKSSTANKILADVIRSGALFDR